MQSIYALEDSHLQAGISAVSSKGHPTVWVLRFLMVQSGLASCSLGHTSFAGISCGLLCWWTKHSLSLQMRWVGVGWGLGARKGKSQDVMFNSVSQIGRCFGWGQHLISQFQVKEVILHDVGGMHRISWRLNWMKTSATWSKRKLPADCFQASSVHQISRTSRLPWRGTAPSDVLVLEPAGLHCECGCASLHDHVSQFLLTNLSLDAHVLLVLFAGEPWLIHWTC